MKVLVADDSPTTRFALKKNLKEWGYEVVEVSDGEKAWMLLNQEDPPRISILDWMMPGMDGVEICSKLQELQKGLLTYTILLTSKTEKKDLVYALDKGAHDFLSKPVFPEELRSRIAVGRRLVEMDQLKNKFLGIAAHDLRNPLISIRGMAELILESADPVTSQQEEFLKMIIGAGTDMLNLINDLLDVSAIQSGRLELHCGHNELKPIVHKQIQLIKTHADRKNIALDTDLYDVESFPFDANRITQVIDNLLSNAVKFSYPDGTVHITLKKSGDGAFAKFIVQDEGPGISETDQFKLFDEYRRLSTKPTGGESSTGLGLAIVKKIVDAHKGILEVKSEEGKGASFIFKLPIRNEC